MRKQNEKKEEGQPNSVRIVFPTWKGSRAYRAVESLMCAGYDCGKTIDVGELSTRHKPQAASSHSRVQAFCRNGVPFVEVERTYELFLHEDQQSQWRPADEQEWQEHYGSRSIFGTSIHIIEAQKE